METMTTKTELFNSIKQVINHNVIDSLQEAGYDNTMATKLVTQFEGLEANDLVFESDSSF
jgi:hypothetical protein